MVKHVHGSYLQGMAKKRGRPSKYTPEIAREICERLGDGETLRGICKDAHIPPAPTVVGWYLDDREGFAEQYTRARRAQALHWAEEIMTISDETQRDTYVDSNGRERTDHEVVARSRLRVDTRKWLLSKVLPKVYGEKLDVGFPDGTPKVVFELTHEKDAGEG